MRATILMVAVAATVAACSNSQKSTREVYTPTGPVNLPNHGVAEVDVSPTSATIVLGASTRLVALPRDGSGAVIPDARISWRSSDTLVATVSDSGRIQGKKVGNARVIASSEGVEATATIVVNKIPVGSVSVSLASSSLQVGTTTQATAVVKDSTGAVVTDRTVTWSSSAPNVASVSGAGVVTALAAGTATISATSEGKVGSATVTNSVAPPPPPAPVASVTVTLNSSSLTTGQTTQAAAVLKDANGNTLSGRAIAWSSSNSSVATVSSTGLVTAVAVGSANIVATSEGISGQASVTVSTAAPPPVASVTVTLNSASLTAGQNTQATAVTKDASGNVLTGRTITWSSSNTAVASVNSAGLVTAVAAGSANIVATSEGKSGSAAVSVAAASPPPVATVTVSLAASTLTVGQTTNASVVLKDASGNVLTGRVVTWSSSNSSVATVSASGAVTAVAPGSANIIATSEGKTGSATESVTSPTPPPSGTEPVYTPGVSTLAFFEDFESYTNASSFTSGGWALSTTSMPLSAPAGSGKDGLGRGAQLAWTSGLDWIGADHGVGDQGSSRVAYMSWDYRAPNFSYGGTQTAQLEKKHMIINLGQNTRITVEMHGYAGEEALVVAMVQTSGPYLFENPSVTPWGDQHATIQHLTDGAWHHFTVKRTAESRNGALDGAIELWLDGQKLFNMQNIGTSTDQIINCEFASTFNGGSPKNQTEWYDNIRIWY